MPTYEYKCEDCGIKFEKKQNITEAAVIECPQCKGKVSRIVSGGAGFITKGSNKMKESCSLETTGMTCCGRKERCGKPSCGN